MQADYQTVGEYDKNAQGAALLKSDNVYYGIQEEGGYQTATFENCLKISYAALIHSHCF